MPAYPPAQEACAHVLSSGHRSEVAENLPAWDREYAETHRVCVHTAAHAWDFKDSVMCCTTQAPGLQFVTPCTEEA